MIMETLSCGYPVAPSGLCSAASSPITSDDSFAPQLYSQTQYVQPSYSTSPIHTAFSKYEEDANNNNHIYNTNRNISHKLSNSSDDSLLSDFGSLSLSESEERYGDLSPVSETSDFMSDMSQSPPSTITNASSRSKQKKNSRSKAKSSTQSQDGEEKKSRKDSFVYDVRLPDEQFLFFVPDLDLVKSHLMFAVREEVDVLKERIVELMDRIKHLECENTILRQYASQEVLQQIQNQMPHPMPPHHSSTS